MGTLKKVVALMSAIGLLCVTSLFAATGWTRVDYTNSTTFVGFILVSEGYVPSAQAGDSIGAFVGDECRMKAKLFKSPNSDTLWVSAVLHGGGINPKNDPSPVSNDGETVSFKIWHKATDKVASLAGTTTSIPGGNIYKFPLGKTAKSTDATVASIAIKAAVLAPTFKPETVEYTVELANGTALPVEADYTITTGDAKAVVSAVYATNFTTKNVTTITVTAEDGKTIKTYTVAFTQATCLVAKPTAPATATACAGEKAEITATSTETNPTFSWTNGAGDIVSTNALLSTNIAGTYFVTQTAGCTGPAAEVVVSIITTTPITLAPNHSLSNPICISATVDLAGIAIPAGGVYSGVGVKDGILTAQTAGVGTGLGITYTTTENGCPAVKTINYDVVAKPTVDLKGLPLAVCYSGDAFVLTGGTPANGEYTIGNSTVTNFNPALYTGDVTVKYSYSSIEGCSNTATAVITVNKVAPVVTTDQAVILPLTPNAFVISTETGATVTWYNKDKQVIAGAGASFVPTETAEGTYTYYVSQKVGECESEMSMISLAITNCDTKAPSVDKLTETVCAGTVTTFTATPTNGNELLWKDAMGTVIQGSATLTPATNKSGSFIFYASQKSTAANSCESPQTKVTLDVNEVPVVSISIPSTSLTTASAAVEITVSPAEAILSGTGITAGSYTFNPSVAGEGTHTLTAEITIDGCVGTDSKDITVGKKIVNYAELLAAIASANTKMSTTNEGSAIGDQTVGSKGILTAAVSAASNFLTSVEQVAIMQATADLNAAIAVYEQSIVRAVNTDLLEAAITSAKKALNDAKQGYAVNEYFNLSATDGAIKTALTEAAAKLESFTTAGTAQDVVDAANALNAIKADFIARANKTDLTDLVLAIEAAETKFAIAEKNIGFEVGQYNGAEVNALQAAIEAAKTLLKSADKNAIIAGITELNKKAAISPIAGTDLVALNKTIADAQVAVDNAVVGTDAGQVTAAVKKALVDAIATAKDAATSTDQKVVDAANATLESAIDTFINSFNTGSGLDYTVLDYTRDSASTLLNNTQTGTSAGTVTQDVWLALSQAKKTADALRKTAKTQSEITKITEDLNLDITIFLASVKTAVNVNATDISVYPTLVSESVTIEGLTGNTIITIVNIEASSAKTLTTSASTVIISADEFAKGLNTITTISSNGSSSVTKVIVE